MFFILVEAPIDREKGKHFDAIVFDPVSGTVFSIESKRYSEKYKIGESHHDIERILDPKHQSLITANLHDMEVKKRVGIILADVWLEKEFKKEVYEEWPKAVQCGEQPIFAGKCDFDHVKTEKSVRTEYKLLVYAFEIK